MKGISIAENELHVHRLSFLQTEAFVKECESFLSTDERERAAQFIFEADRRKYIIGRGRLRKLLAAYLNTLPNTLSFRYGKAGKPFLEHYPLQFNLSHSHEMALIGVHSQQEIGLDIEWARQIKDLDSLAKTVYTAPELAIYNTCPLSDKRRLFYDLWTCKEAFIKGTGEGFTRNPQSITLPIPEMEKDAWFLPVVDDHDTQIWQLKRINAPNGYRAAVAVCESVEQVRIFTETFLL